MAGTYNVFISWSGERSRQVAKALYDWLPSVLQTARPWMSQEDIEKGSRALEEIGKAMEEMSVGVICLTPENAEKPWIHFEAGALSKKMGEKTRVCPYLFGGLRGEQVRLPLGIFQAARAEKEETRKMVLSVNRALGSLVDERSVDAWFERDWHELEEKLEAIPAAKEAAPPHGDEKKMVTQLLELAQAAANSDAKLREEVRELRYVLTRLAERRVPVSAALGGAGIGSRSTGVLDGNLAAWMTPGSPETGGHIAVPQARAVAHSNSVVTMAEVERQLAELREGLKRLKGGTEEEKDDVEKK